MNAATMIGDRGELCTIKFPSGSVNPLTGVADITSSPDVEAKFLWSKVNHSANTKIAQQGKSTAINVVYFDGVEDCLSVVINGKTYRVLDIQPSGVSTHEIAKIIMAR